jgi:hypothetical protein
MFQQAILLQYPQAGFGTSSSVKATWESNYDLATNTVVVSSGCSNISSGRIAVLKYKLTHGCIQGKVKISYRKASMTPISGKRHLALTLLCPLSYGRLVIDG